MCSEEAEDRTNEQGGKRHRPDPDTLRLAFAGDREAFHRVVEQLWGLVYVFIRQRISDRERAEDLTQESFLQAWEKRGSLRNSESAVSWILAIASRKVIDSHRWFGVRPETRLPEREEPAEVSAGEPGLDPQRAEALRTILGEIPELYRTVLILRYWSGLTPAQIARLLEEPEGTIRNRIFRAHLLLRERLAKESLPRESREVEKTDSGEGDRE